LFIRRARIGSTRPTPIFENSSVSARFFLSNLRRRIPSYADANLRPNSWFINFRRAREQLTLRVAFSNRAIWRRQNQNGISRSCCFSYVHSSVSRFVCSSSDGYLHWMENL